MRSGSITVLRALGVAGALLAGQAAEGVADPAPAMAAAGPMTWEGVDAVFGMTGKSLPGGVERYAWPRTDLAVRIGDVTLKPALALGSWAGFLRTGMGAKAMVMGDPVLLDPEVTPVLSALEKSATPLTPGAPASPSPDETAALKKVEEALGRPGTMAGTVLQVGVPRAETITEAGMEIPASIGMGNSMNFQVAGNRVASTGDFVLLAAEVNPVIRELRARGIEVTALHSHMLAEAPRLFFMHFWVVDAPEKVGAGLRAALAKVHTR